MTQETGTEILARARIKAQDNDASQNYAVSDATALILLNDILVAVSNDVEVKPKWVAASTSGLTFTSGTASKVTTADVNATEIESFHQSGSSSITHPLPPALKRISVQEIMELFGADGDTTLGPTASEWTHVAAEKSQSDTSSGVEHWRVFAYPVINRTRYIHLRVPAPVTISALTDKPDVATVNSRVLSSLLAYKIAKLKKETSPSFLQGILEDVPAEVVRSAFGSGVRRSQLQDRIAQVSE
jgi:hypothetical protein